MLDPYDEGASNDTLAQISATPYISYEQGPIPWIDEDEGACFPLSGPVHEYLHWITQTTHTPTVFHLGSYLAQLCHRFATLGMRVEVGGRAKRPRIYALLVAPSGVGKSTPIHRANTFFGEHCARVGNVVVPQSFPITADSTAAGISRVLQDSVTAFGENEIGLFVCEEAERIFHLRRQHPVDSLFCGLYDGHFTQHITAKNLVEVKKGEDNVTKLAAPIVSLLFAMPEASFTGDGMDKASDAGLIPRFMVFRGRVRPPKAYETAMPLGQERAARSLDEAVQWFLQLRNGIAAGESPWPDDPNDGLIRVRLSEGAAKVYHERVVLHDLAEYERMRDPTVHIPERERNFRAYRLRAYDQAYMIAALYALSQKRLIIHTSDMQRALNLTDMSIAYMRETLAVLGRDPLIVAKDYILALLHEAKEPLREKYLHGRLMQRYPDLNLKAFDVIFPALIASGGIRRIDPVVDTKTTGGRPQVPRYVLRRQDSLQDDEDD